MSKIFDMDPTVIVAIIGATGTVLAAFVSVRRQTKQARLESNEQHGVLLTIVEMIKDRTDDISDDVKNVRHDLQRHIADHDATVKPDAPQPKKRVAAKKPK